MQPPHPDPRSGEPVDNPDDGVQRLHPNRPENLPRKPSATAATRDPPPAESGGSAREYFAALGDRWQLTGRQRVRLIPAVMAALAAGWTPHGLAAFTGANTTGVRNPCAVLAAALTRRAAPATGAASDPAAVVPRVRPGHPDARV